MNFSSPANLLIAGIYFVLVGVLVFFGIFGAYILIRYGESRMASIAGSIIFGVFFLTILGTSYHALLQILQS